MNHNFKKKYGQNFLNDTNLLSAICVDANISKQDNVLEIGAGAGALTKQISLCAKKVVSYEIDKDLQATLESLNLKNVDFVFEDALKTDIKQIEKNFNGEKYKLVANLPYYITSPLILKFLQESDKVESLTIMVQKEVAERLVAKPNSKDYGALTVMVKFCGATRITRQVGRQMFYPQPNVDSAVVNITLQKKYENVDKTKFFDFVKGAFSMRRKTISNCLSSYLKTNKETLAKLLPDVDLSRRAESFDLEELVSMFLQIESNK